MLGKCLVGFYQLLLKISKALRAILFGDICSNNIIAGKADGVETWYVSKAAVKEFPGETNFSVITGDGSFFSSMSFILDKAETDLRRVKDQVQLQREMKQRKDAAGKAGRFAAGQSKMMLDFKQDRAEASQGAANRLADRQLSTANEALDEAKARFEVLIPLNVVMPDEPAVSKTGAGVRRRDRGSWRPPSVWSAYLQGHWS